jgi:hypothetical protein
MNARYMMNERRFARTLGWLGIGVGLLQLAAPRRLGRAIGVGERPRMMRLVGARAVATGAGLLAQREPLTGIRTRVAGDVVDLALLALALRAATGGQRWRIGATALLVTGVLALDALGSRRLADRLY